jgi:hypothetical protein
MNNWLFDIYYRPSISIIQWSNKMIFAHKRERRNSILRVIIVSTRVFPTMSVIFMHVCEKKKTIQNRIDDKWETK